jgi:lipoprotein-anchoring transpeptidase ErfK/SrfK
MEQMIALERLGYASPVEMLAERFHMDEALLRALNPGKPFDRPDTTIIVANVGENAPQAKRPDKADKVVKIVVDRKRGELSAFAKDDRLIAVYPASVGSEQTPSPVGTHKVQAIVKNPSYTYRPEYAFKGVKAKKPFTLKPGPNSPVGSVWIDLTEPTYGIHGTAHPERVGKASSEGCVRLTNWDAEELAMLAQKGTAVEFGSEG